ncbi:T9SS type A sorting domain-containing protein [Aquimarina sp. TRL1]|uniref:fibronectin type III domain-containing protein n=1 Tax=Aquimarina sp. (strain TRL1) TaxID=2736252 RepID=UPI00158E5394|nr:T9SS type A sorting domain-containing protein [Aquimarina sp. TRL1]QKX04930.1 T9SS type A sorting domain-containing protein [Aquimarina sp. TRL1]
MKRILLFLVALFLVFLEGQSQVSQKGTPVFEGRKVAKSAKMMKVHLPSLDIEKLEKEDIEEEKKGVPMRFAYGHKVVLNFENSGNWFTAKNGDKFWLLEIESTGAKSLNITFDEFFMAEGASLFVYNEGKTMVKGAFTSFNNKKTGDFSIAPVKGDKIILEYYQPKTVKGKSRLQISTVAHDYKGIYKLAKDFGDSGSCHNNINCDEGDGWKDQSRSVALVTLGNGTRWCTGTLINNSKNDGTPYFLTANHCTEDEGRNPANWIFIFNYESPSCESVEVSTDDSISGCRVLANGVDSDYLLLELSVTPPERYNVYYSGWDAREIIPTNTVGIHHPWGDIKKISFDHDAPEVTKYYDREKGSGITHWHVKNWESGTTEKGSSGSALFNPEKRIIGQLHGGDAACGIIDSDWYGRLSVTYPNICQWLAPGCSEKVMDGYQPIISDIVDNERPTKVTGVRVDDVQETTIRVSWNSSTDNRNVIGYYVYVNDKLSAFVEDTTVLLSELRGGTQYIIKIKARDEVGNESDFSEEVLVETLPEKPCEEISVWEAGTEYEQGNMVVYKERIFFKDYSEIGWSYIGVCGEGEIKGSIEFPPVKNELKVYPNPILENTLYVSFKANNDAVMYVYDVGGHVVTKMKFQSFLPVGKLPSGMYILEVISNGRSYQKRFIRK